MSKFINLIGQRFGRLTVIQWAGKDKWGHSKWLCRYSPLDNQEVDKLSMYDRTIVSGLYYFYRNEGGNEETAARKARAIAIRLVLNEVFS